MKCNANDGIQYLTAEEWINTKETLKAIPAYDTAKFYEVDTGTIHIIYNGSDYTI